LSLPPWLNYRPDPARREHAVVGGAASVDGRGSKLHSSQECVDIDLELNDGAADLVSEASDLAIRIGKRADTSQVARTLAPCRTSLAPTSLRRTLRTPHIGPKNRHGERR